MGINKKRMLIAGGGYADIPLILSAKRLGYHVITSGNRAEDLGHPYADEYHPADFSSGEAMLEVAQKQNIAAICACCNDFAALSAAYVAERLGLPGHDSYACAQVIHHKDAFRAFATQHGFPVPRAIGAMDAAAAMAAVGDLNLPVLVKPVDLTGGKGISVVKHPDEAEAAVAQAFAISRAKRVVVEEYVTGSRHGFSAFLVDGKVRFYFSDNEHYYLNPYLVSAASVPAVVPPGTEVALCAIAERMAGLLALKTGIFHVQYILHDGAPVLIEVCRRAPGDLYIRLVEHATGVDYPGWIVRAAAGLDCSGLTHVEPRGCFTRHCVMASRTGRLRQITFDASIRDQVIDQMMWGKAGDEVTDVMTAKFGIVFLKFGSRAEMLDKVERMQRLILAEVE